MLESYIMFDKDHTHLTDEYNEEKVIIVKRMDLLLNDEECQVINFIDVSAYQRLEDQQKKTNLLSTLNSYIHNEIIGPLHLNVEITKRLI